ncbi:MAG: hypothetical protein WCJ33_00310 [Pseudomonadota bacterium]
MAYSLGTLTAYVEQNSADLLTKAVFSAKTKSMLTPKVGIKSAETINKLDTDAVIQAGGSCGFNSSGTTTITQRTLTVGKMKIQESLCPADLEAYYTQGALMAGSNYDMIAYAKDYTDLKVKLINKALETLIWNARLSAGDYFDGFIRIFQHEPTVVEANTSAYVPGGTALTTYATAGNALKAFQAVNAAIPVEVIDATDMQVFCGWDTFRALIRDITNLNFFAYNVSSAEAVSGELTIPGTALKVTAVNGLNGTNSIYAGQKSNMFYGTDLLSEEDKFTLKYDEYSDLVRFSVKFKAGVQIAFPQFITAFRIPPGS